MCAGANSSAATVSKTDLLIIPLIRKTTDGMTDRANALTMPFFFQQTIQRMQYNATSRASRMRYRAVWALVRCPAKPSPRNVEDHKTEAAESANLFYQLDGLAPVIVSKSVLAANRKDNVGNHDDGYENQTKRIKPFHIKDQPPCYQLTVFLVFILTFGMLKVNNNVKITANRASQLFSQTDSRITYIVLKNYFYSVLLVSVTIHKPRIY